MAATATAHIRPIGGRSMTTGAAPTTTSITTSSKTSKAANFQHCPNCRTSLSDPYVALLESQTRIVDLEAQVRLLNQKAAAAVDRWADYEDELSRLRAASTSTASSNHGSSVSASHTATSSSFTTPATTTTTTAATSPGTTTTANTNASSNPTTSALAAAIGSSLSATTAPASPRLSGFLPSGATTRSISALLAPRKFPSPITATHNNSLAPPSPPPHVHALGSSPAASRSSPHLPSTNTNTSTSTEDLVAALRREQELRRAAEGKLDETGREVEELSVSLFEQANEMVAAERRARAKLEERVGVLERRDEEKRARLGRLEGAMGRLERVRELLGVEL